MSSDAPSDVNKTIGYCRACGKALNETNVRTAHGTIYCEEHLPMENVIPTVPTAAGPARPEPPSPYSSTGPLPGTNPPVHTEVSPGLAFGLGVIPGVGAIYNGQYGKGLIHIVIFGLMISLLDSGRLHHMEVLISLLLAGFCAYMPFEAFHTAKKHLAGHAVDEFSSLFPIHGQSARLPVVPIVLIALGTLFLLSNLNLLDIDRLLDYWPALLIALGVYMLASRFGSEAPQADKEATHGRQ